MVRKIASTAQEEGAASWMPGQSCKACRYPGESSKIRTGQYPPSAGSLVTWTCLLPGCGSCCLPPTYSWVTGQGAIGAGAAAATGHHVPGPPAQVPGAVWVPGSLCASELWLPCLGLPSCSPGQQGSEDFVTQSGTRAPAAWEVLSGWSREMVGA